MNTIAAENVHSASQRRGHRRHEDRVTAVRKLFDDECGYKSILYFGQRGLPGLIFALTGESLRETSKQSVARDFVENRTFDSSPNRLTR